MFEVDAAFGFSYPRYDVSPDDRRFLMMGRDDSGAEPTLVRVEIFLEALNRGS